MRASEYRHDAASVRSASLAVGSERATLLIERERMRLLNAIGEVIYYTTYGIVYFFCPLDL